MAETWLLVFVVAFVVGLAGLFLYGWRRRKEKPPPGVKPLTDDDDW
jgi:LPXTG-motif cell wall-anchored protein